MAPFSRHGVVGFFSCSNNTSYKGRKYILRQCELCRCVYLTIFAVLQYIDIEMQLVASVLVSLCAIRFC